MNIIKPSKERELALKKAEHHAYIALASLGIAYMNSRSQRKEFLKVKDLFEEAIKQIARLEKSK